MSQAAHGESLLDAGQYAEAVEAFTKAISEAPTSPDYFLKRSLALHKSKEYEKALSDCETAINLAYSRGTKSVRANAQFRRALALSCLGRPGDAKFCLDRAISDGCKDKALDVWKLKITKAAAEAPDSIVTIQEIPDLRHVGHGKDVTAPIEEGTGTTAEQSRDDELPAAYKKPKFEWYQTNEKLTVTFYVKKVPKDKCSITITDRSLSLEFPIPENNSEYSHGFEHLYGAVDPDASSYRILGTKIEVVLIKASPGKWPTLESTEVVAPVKMTYPTSSRTGSKNWDSLGAGIEEDKKEGDAALTDLFQTLYKDADEDTKKAMIKSYTESGGTSLSTDWKSVKNGKVETVPPEGMEARRYSS